MQPRTRFGLSFVLCTGAALCACIVPVFSLHAFGQEERGAEPFPRFACISQPLRRGGFSHWKSVDERVPRVQQGAIRVTLKLQHSVIVSESSSELRQLISPI